MKARLFLTVSFLALSCGLAAAQDEPGRLHRLTEAGNYDAQVGDMIEVALDSNPSTGPANPNAKLIVEISGQGLGKKAHVVFQAPTRPIPGAGGHILAFVPAESVGHAVMTVKPISGTGKEGEALVFKINVSKAP